MSVVDVLEYLIAENAKYIIVLVLDPKYLKYLSTWPIVLDHNPATVQLQ